MTINKKRILLTLLINIAAIIAVIGFTHIFYESNDDYSIASRIAVDKYYYLQFNNYFLSRIIGGIQQCFTQVNVFVMAQLILSFISFSVITFIFLDVFQNRRGSILSILILAVFACDHYSAVQYTKTSALILTAAMLFIVHMMLRKKKRSPACYVAGAVLFLLGAWFRYSNTYAVLGFGTMLLLAGNIQEFVQGGSIRKQLKRAGLHVFTIAMLAVVVYAFNFCSNSIINANPEVQQYVAYSRARSQVLDYPVISYEDNKKALKEIGLTPNDCELIYFNYLDYNGAASIENLRNIGAIADKEIQEKNSSGLLLETLSSSIKELDRRGIHIILILVLLVLGLFLLKKEWCIYALVLFFTVTAGYFYLSLLGRCIYRASYVLDLSAFVYLLYSVSYCRCRLKETSWYKILMYTAMTAVIFWGFAGNVREVNKEYGALKKGEDILIDYTEKRKDQFFVFSRSVSSARPLDKYFGNPLEVPPKSYQSNVSSSGGWSTMSPYFLEKLHKNGFSNLFGDAVDSDKMYLVDLEQNMEKLQEYFNKWYGEQGKHIVFERTDAVGEFQIFQVKTIVQ